MRNLMRGVLILIITTIIFISCASDDDSDSDDTSDTSDDTEQDDDSVTSDDDVSDDSADDDSADDDTVAAERYWFYDDQNRTLIYHGVQIIQNRDPYISWHTEDDYGRMNEWGFNLIRFGVDWAAVEPEQGVYNEEFLTQLDERIKWARERGIGIILEMHQDVYGEKYGGNGAPEWACQDGGVPYAQWDTWYLNYLQPAVIAAFNRFWHNTDGMQDSYIALWTYLAERYADEPAVVGYDLMNEPFFGTNLPFRRFDREVLMPFYKKLILAMQEVDMNHFYFVEPAGAIGAGLPCYMQDLGLPNVAYAPHMYPFLPNILSMYMGQGESIKTILRQGTQTAQNMKVPIWFGEWALFNAGTQNRERYMADSVRVFDKYLASWSYWIYNKDDNVGLLDSDGNERTWVLDIISRPYPQATAGYPTGISFDLDTSRFEMEWDENAAATGPTEIFIPAARHYPDGFTVSCSDPDGAWSYEWDDARSVLLVTADRSLSSHTITVEKDTAKAH
jgi:endoglycosylceramidase